MELKELWRIFVGRLSILCKILLFSRWSQTCLYNFDLDWKIFRYTLCSSKFLMSPIIFEKDRGKANSNSNSKFVLILGWFRFLQFYKIWPEDFDGWWISFLFTISSAWTLSYNQLGFDFYILFQLEIIIIL